jgi:hemerythrin-like domain-containing protein
MSDPIALWHTEHVNFAALLDLLDAQLDRFHRGEAPDYELMLDIMFYMTHYPDVLHHPKEELAFERIAARDVTAGRAVERLAAEHSALKHEGNALVIALDDIVNGSVTSREHVEAPGRAYIAAFRRHMRAEEAEILPLAGKLLDQGDWAAIEAAIRNLEDPVFGRSSDERYAALRRHITREVRAAKASERS